MDPKELAEKEVAIKKKEDELKTQAADFAGRETKLKEKESAARRDDIEKFVGAQVKAGKVLPRNQAGLIEFMVSLDESDTIEFGEADARKKTSSGAFLREFIAQLPHVVDYNERTKATDDSKIVKHVDVPHGYSVDPARAELHGKALEYAASNNCDYVTAVTAVNK